MHLRCVRRHQSRAHHAAQVHVISVAAKRRQVDSGVAKKNTPAIHQVPGPWALIFFLLVRAPWKAVGIAGHTEDLDSYSYIQAAQK